MPNERLADTEVVTLESTMAAIARLWNDERCTLEFQYVPEWSGNDAEHTVVLEWTDDSDWLREVVTYKTYRWQFNADTFAQAALDALDWCERLAPWKRCDECDGLGEWNGKPCEWCKATGLASEQTIKEPF